MVATLHSPPKVLTALEVIARHLVGLGLLCLSLLNSVWAEVDSSEVARSSDLEGSLGQELTGLCSELKELSHAETFHESLGDVLTQKWSTLSKLPST